MSERVIDILKLQVATTSDLDQAKETLELLQTYGYKAVPALRDILRDSQIEEIKESCREAMRKLGWFPE